MLTRDHTVLPATHTFIQWLKYQFRGPRTLEKFGALLEAERASLNLLVPITSVWGLGTFANNFLGAQERRSPAFPLILTTAFIHRWNEPYLPLLPSRRASPHFGRYSFSVPLRVGGCVGLSGWLQTEVVYPPADGHPSQY